MAIAEAAAVPRVVPGLLAMDLGRMPNAEEVAAIVDEALLPALGI